MRLWNAATGQQLKTLFKAKDPTYDVTYSRDGSILAAVADDGFVRFWHAKTLDLLLEAKVDKEGLYSVVFTPQQSSVLTGGIRGTVMEFPAPKLGAE